MTHFVGFFAALWPAPSWSQNAFYSIEVSNGNAGDNASCPACDQRSVNRPQALICDIGAVESLTWPRAYLPITRR